MFSKQEGLSLVEMMIAVALASVLGMTGYSLYQFSKKNSDRMMDDIQTTITRLGASAVIKRDLSAADLSFNFLNILDDKKLPFFTLSKNQYCKHNKCSREITLSLSANEDISKPVYFIVRKSLLNEVQKLTVHPKAVFDGTVYGGINWQFNSPMYSLSQNHFPQTSWIADRLMLVSSENDFFDCNISSMSNKSSICQLECSGTCDFTIKRPYRFLGVVAPEPSKDLNAIIIDNKDDLLLKNYDVCRPNKTNGCASHIKANVTTTRNLYENLPYTPGADDRTSIYHVEVVKYYLQRENKTTHLMRALGSYKSGRVKFDHAVKIMTGLEAVIFNRVNISNPSIEYRFITAKGEKISNN